MIKAVFEESSVFVIWVLISLISLVLGMRNDGGQKQQQGGVPRPARSNSFIPNSFRAISSYLRIVSSGASTVARSAASVASSIVDRDDDTNHDQVNWAGFDNLEGEGNLTRQVLLLGYRSGFQVWDVEEADNVRDLVSRYDGAVSYMQMLPKPIASKRSEDNFEESRPLLVVCADGSISVGNTIQDGTATPCNGITANSHDTMNSSFVPTVVRFYSLKSQSYVHVLKFRSVVYSLKCSPRVVAISLAAQIHCFDAMTFEREYTILTNPIVMGFPGSGGIGCGPLALGNRWLAYSGSPVAVSNSGRVSPQHLEPSASISGFPSNGSLVAHYAKESSKQLAAGIVTLGDMGYKKLSRYCSELIPDSNTSLQSPNPVWKVNGAVNGLSTDTDNVGMVIVRDIVNKAVIAQFRAHTSPISALRFDPSGTLLVTASTQGHNINVFKIMPGSSPSTDGGASYVHLYRLQRGLTNAIIQDISFSDDSNWIMVSSSRGTSHLFAINPWGGSVNLPTADAGFTTKSTGLGVTTRSSVRWPGLQTPNQQSLCSAGPPVTLSVVSRIRNGNNSWRGTVTGAAAAATGKMSSLSGAVASSFHNCKGNAYYLDHNSSKAKYHLLVFSPSGSMIQYALRISNGLDLTAVAGLNTAYESGQEGDTKLVVEAIRKWNVCQKQNRRERDDTSDIYGENVNFDNNKIYPEGKKKGNTIYPEACITFPKAKISSEEKHQLYISEAELQMHEARSPVWAKPELNFQSMIMEGVKMDDETASGGEIEIERIPTCMIEARSKDLVPVFEYLQAPIFQQTRVASVDSNFSGQLLRQRSGISENGGRSCRNSSSSLDTMTESGAGVAELTNGIEVTGQGGSQMPTESMGFVNNNNSPKTETQLETVNNRESSLKLEAQLKSVNNDIDSLGVGNLFGIEGDAFD
ncbi:autophagy-related protein 18f [Pyrus x bretschneideri]|uniref:autophagy-related protein 18f n=1 Tax=Pyrus x bretschneideri TaxID=225117 RepID=UPI0005116D27|nr:autophagy-related protein 18f [Pyrus x bretschneideri]XP_009358093.2 autophagy-related protein 18f [Pyrus x bretschneideri]